MAEWTGRLSNTGKVHLPADPSAAGDGIRVERYGKRYWAVYDGEELLCVTLYKKGALAITERLINPNKATHE